MHSKQVARSWKSSLQSNNRAMKNSGLPKNDSPLKTDVEQLPDGDEDVEQAFNAAQEQVNLVDGPNGVSAQAFGPTQDGPAAS